MKKIYLLLITIAFTTFGFGQTTIHCWDFNGTTTTTGNIAYISPVNTSNRVAGNGVITHNFANIGAFGGSTINACAGSVAGNSFCPQGGTGNANNGKIMTLAFPTTGYENIILTFAVQKSAAGFTSNQVAYSTNGGSSFTNLGSAFNPPTSFATQTFDFSTIPAVNNNANFQIRITFSGATDPAGNNRFDNIKLTGTLSCVSPTNQANSFSVSGITNNSANVNWIHPTTGGGDNVLVIMRQGSAVTTDPTNGTSYTANAAYGTPAAQLGTTGNYVVYNGPLATVNVTNLVAGLTYHVAIYEYNNTGLCYKTPALLGNFSTTCPVFGLPFTEGFEAATFPPSCWTSYRGTNGLGIIEDWKRSTTSRTGTGAAYVQFENITPNAIAEDWLVTPAINLAATVNNTLTFWTRDTYTSNFNTVYTVRVSTTSQTNRASFTTIQTYTELELGNAYNQKSIVLPAIYNTGTVYIAFVMAQDDGDDWLIDDVSLTGSAPGNSANSNIVDNGFDPTDDINYISYSAASGLTTANAIKIGEFKIQDGGNSLSDIDTQTTTLTALGFTVGNFANIAALALFDGTTKVKEVTTVTATTSFSSFDSPLSAPDNGSKVFSVYATFKSAVTDNQQIQLTITSATANPAGSTFATANAGGAQTSIAGNDNRIEVTATALNFVQQPTNTFVNAVMAPSPTVRAVDVNANLDLDYVTSVSLSTTGTFSGSATTSATPVAGNATFSNLLFSTAGTFTLTTISGLTNATSSAFDISTVGWQIGIVNQLYTIDFDNTVANVNNGTYAGTGLRPSPNAGQLNSGAWASTGMSDGDLSFGGTALTGDYTNGTSTGGVTTGGFYSFEVAPNNHTFGVQPTGSDFAPGTITLKVQNQTGQTLTSVRFQYIIYVRNDQGRSSSFNFYYSQDNTNFVNAGSLNYTSPTTATGSDWIAIPRNFTVTGLNIPDGDYVYARWMSDDVAGTGSRDEFGLDDIQVIFNPVPASNNSNIVSTSFDEPDNINYLSYAATSFLTTSNAIKIGEFSLQDGGNTLNDADNLSTILTDLSFTVQNFNNLAALAIFDGTTNVSEVTNVTATTIFNDLSLTATDNNSKVFSVYGTFKSAVNDNDQLRLTISSAIASIVGSGFGTTNAGGAQTSVVGDNNRIEVTASILSFSQQPSNVEVNQSMMPAVIVAGVDVNANLDADYSTDVSIISSGTLSGSPVTVSPSAGMATFNNLIHTAPGIGLMLTASNGLFTNIVSDPFDVTVPLTLIAIQDFDGSVPEWTYTHDIAFFDNTWGGDGYYGIIDIASALPLNQSNFSSNILGENDLDDEGDNGTTGFATVTFATINTSLYTDLILTFDWDVVGYNAASDDAIYELFYNGVGQGEVYLVDGGVDPQTNEGTVSVNIPNGTNTVALIIKIRDNGASGYSGFDNFRLRGVAPTPVDYVYTNGWAPGDPSGVANRFDNISIIVGTTSITAPTDAANVTINPGTTLTINQNASLDIQNNLSNDGILTLQSVSNAYSSIVSPNVLGAGTFNYNRHVNTNATSGGNDLISAPFTSAAQTFGVFAGVNGNIVTDPNNANRKLFGPFNKTTGTYQIYNIVDDAAVTLDAGIGYRAASTDNGTFTFTGTFITSNVNTPISIGGPQFQIWNLIGNPYPSYIKLSDFLALNSSKFNTSRSGVYGYNGSASGFEIWNNAYSLANPNAIITPGQGFLVASNSALVDVNFTTGMRTTGTSDDFIPNRLSGQPIAYLQVGAAMASNTYKTDFYFTDLASVGLDPGFDSGVFGTGASTRAIYSQLVQDNQGVDMGIQSLAFADLGTEVSIPLGINAPQGQQVTVSITNSNLPSNIEVYLEDNVTNSFTLLNTSNYVFTPSSNLNSTGRFFLRFNAQTLTNPEASINGIEIYTTTSPRGLFVAGQLATSTSISLYDMQGRMVLSSVLDSASNSNQVDVSNLSSGIYVVKVNNSAQQKTQKVIIK